MAKNWILTASLVTGLLLFGYILGDINLGETLKLIENAQPQYVVGYLFASLGIMLLFVICWDVVMKSRGLKVPLINLFNYRIADYTISFLTPGPKTGGEFTRAALLEKHGIKYGKAFSNVVLDKSIEAFTNCLFFALGTIVVSFMIDLTVFWLIMVYLIALFYLSLFLALYISVFHDKRFLQRIFKFLKLHKINKMKSFEKKINEFEGELGDFYVHDKKSFFFAFIFSSSRWLISFVEFKMILLMIGFDATYAEIFLIFIFFGIGHLFPIPMGLGTIEASQVTVMSLIGLPASAGVMVALINRLRDLLWSALGMIIMGYYGFNVRKILRNSFRNGFRKKTSS